MQNQTTRNQISRRIREHGAPPKVEELCLDEIPLGMFADQVREVVDRCVRVECLSLSGCGLVNLINFPKLQQLQVLDLSHNLLQGEKLEPLSRFLRLYSLNLDSNRIEDFNWTRFFKRIRLITLSLIDNPLTQTCSDRDYRDKMYRALGADLQNLDGRDRNGETIDEHESSESEVSSSLIQQEQSQSESVNAENNSQSRSVSLEPEEDEAVKKENSE